MDLYSFTYFSALRKASARLARRAFLSTTAFSAALAANASLRRFFFRTVSGLYWFHGGGLVSNVKVQMITIALKPKAPSLLHPTIFFSLSLSLFVSLKK